MIAPRAVPEYDALVEKHGLSILFEAGDFSIENGGLRQTTGGDIQLGDATYSAMFRTRSGLAFFMSSPRSSLCYERRNG